MTNNKIFLLENGLEGVVVNRSDGWGIKNLRAAGYKQVILSTEKNPVVRVRAKKLKIAATQGCKDKKTHLKNLCKIKKIELKNVLYVGNDVNDLPAMKIVGLSVAPADSEKTVLQAAKYITTARGGEGVIREISDIILKKKGEK